MTSFQDTLRALDIGFMYNQFTAFVIGGDAYIAVGKVQNTERDYICLFVDNELWLPDQICLVSFLPDTETLSRRVVTAEESIQVGEGQTISCMLLAALVLALTCRNIGYFQGSAEQFMSAAPVMAEVIIKSAQAAGIFSGRTAYEEVMRFGENSHRGRSRDPQAKRLRALRSACRPNNPDALREYASILVAARAIEMFVDL